MWLEWNTTVVYKVYKPERKPSLTKLGRRWEDNIQMDLVKMGIEVINWIQLAQNKQ